MLFFWYYNYRIYFISVLLGTMYNKLFNERSFSRCKILTLKLRSPDMKLIDLI